MPTNDPTAINDDAVTDSYRYDTEPPRQGGRRYIICQQCGREHVSGRPDRILHQRGCPLSGADR